MLLRGCSCAPTKLPSAIQPSSSSGFAAPGREEIALGFLWPGVGGLRGLHRFLTRMQTPVLHHSPTCNCLTGLDTIIHNVMTTVMFQNYNHFFTGCNQEITGNINGTSCCCDIILPYQVYNTSYDIAHRCVRTRRLVRIEDDTTCRLCGTDTETVAHVVLHCPALAAKVWPALLSFLAGLGLNRDDSDEGTLSAKRF